MKNVIEVSGLQKSFGTVRAVRDLSFCVRQGELFAFLGVNGAGKSTTIKILCAQLQKDAGRVAIDGTDLDENAFAIKEKIGVVYQNSLLDASLSVYENLRCRAALYGIVGDAFAARLAELCELLSLHELLSRTVGKLSGGQRRRIDIARALLHQPKILILDEPTTGLDPQTRRLLWSVIEKLRRKTGMTVFLTTHYMEEAADADFVVILDNGSVVAQGTPHELKTQYARDTVTLYGVAQEVVESLGLPYHAVRDGFALSVESTRAATDLILAHPDLFCDYEVVRGNMDAVFLAVTGKNLQEEKPL